MKSIILIFVSTLISISSYAGGIRIGLIPGNGQEIQERADRFAGLLSKEVNQEVSVYIPKDYQDLIHAMRDKKVDFAFFTAMSFVYAEKEANAKVLLKSVWDNPFYFSTIVTHPDSKIQSLQDLKGKRVAFVDKKSTSGYLMPCLRLQEENIEVEKVFTGNHKASVEKLMNKEVDAIAVFANDEAATKGAWNVYFEDSTFIPRVLWVSQSMPTDPFTVRQDFFMDNQDLSYDVMFAMMGMPKLDKSKNLLQDTLGVRKLVVANSAQYNPIRKLIAKLKE